MEIPLYVICCFSLVAFNIFSVFNFCQFHYYVSQCVPTGLILYETLCFLDLGDCFLSHVKEVFSYNVVKYFLRPFLFFFSPGTPIMRTLVHLILSQRPLKLSSFLFILFSLSCSMAVISTTLSSSSLIRSSASFILLLILSSVFFISVTVFFKFVWLFFIFSNSLLKTFVTSHSVHPFFS